MWKFEFRRISLGQKHAKEIAHIKAKPVFTETLPTQESEYGNTVGFQMPTVRQDLTNKVKSHLWRLMAYLICVPEYHLHESSQKSVP
jgi:hypothetical protein